MSAKIIISQFPFGQTTNATQFNIDNKAFVSLYNFYCWRQRILRKPGTESLGRLLVAVYSSSTSSYYYSSPFFSLSIAGAGNATLNAPIVSGSISLTDGVNTYLEPVSPDGTLVGTPTGTGTINYATGAIAIVGGNASGSVTGNYSYYPLLPGLGAKSMDTDLVNYQETISFDSKYAYMFNQVGNAWYNISFYKGTNSPFTWSGFDYRQFWSTNYQGALWVTNFTPGFHAKLSSSGAITLSYTSTTTLTVTVPLGHGMPLASPPFISGKIYIWFNEFVVTGSDPATSAPINGWSATVTSVTDANVFTATLNLTNNTAAPLTTGGAATGGLYQYLNFNDGSTTEGDGIRWFDGDPTNLGNPNPPTGKGWVNFAPPVGQYDPILNPNPQYVVGCLCISEFKDRLLFFAPWLQSSNQTSPSLYQDRVVFCWNGTPYYSEPVPSASLIANRSYSVSQSISGQLGCAWWWSPAGFGGFQGSGLQQQVISVGKNEDVLLVDFENQKTKLVYTSNDLRPFEFYAINTELTTTSTFASIVMDQGKISVGSYGFTMTTQTSCDRIDLDIPDQIFTFKSSDNGISRMNGVRDFRNEYVFFNYASTENSWIYPTRALLFNYRNNTWAMIKESFTAQGFFQRVNTYLWGQLGSIFGTWGQWNVPFGAGRTSSLYPNIIGINAQGFVSIKTPDTTGEAPSGYVSAIAIVGDAITITSVNHCLEENDYIYFTQMPEMVNMNSVNGNAIVFSVRLISGNANEFLIFAYPGRPISGTYIGLGVFTVLAVPQLLTKEFNLFWDQGRQMRLGKQMYLFDRTDQGQCIVNLYVNQNSNEPANQLSPDSGMIYSQTVLTSSEPFSLNSNSERIWHRIADSIIGDTVQIGITLSDAQMRDPTLGSQTSSLTLHAIVMDVSPSSVLAF